MMETSRPAHLLPLGHSMSSTLTTDGGNLGHFYNKLSSTLSTQHTNTILIYLYENNGGTFITISVHHVTEFYCKSLCP